MPQPPLDRDLLNRLGSRLELSTPALVLDLDALEANLAAMTAWAKSQGIALRPHAKTHKCAAIGRLQMEQGALGLCCAKLAEAEALAEAGLDRLLLTSPVVGARRIARLMTLARNCAELMLVATNPGTLRERAAAAAAAGITLDILIDVDVGQERTGVRDADAALLLAGIIAEAPALTLKGVQGYAGHVQHIADFEERRRASAMSLGLLAAVRDRLEAADHPCPIVSGGGTGTHALDPASGVLNELQVGSYIVSDVEYDAVDLTGDGTRRFRDGLFVYARVVSANRDGFATIDAGSKVLSMDGPAPAVAFGAPEGTTYRCSGDEFGELTLPPGSAPLKPGDLVGLVVPHCDPTINFFDFYHCVRGEELVDLWPIEARGCSA
ncbi:DSD1 family PLP-dependent enzyme [Pelagibius marinus]|uniref:DSD1 family PLP-dependent enzyme n=1 Tax=Pelagibius marinus TaxID=2762760 RepID=UPI001872975A|nr:DSD1 family PLP-dependent enzyme [Pelagibius marinus]